jgi:peptidoglycan/xylan/chitin deacetylase (PgdA/CDA1 family)
VRAALRTRGCQLRAAQGPRRGIALACTPGVLWTAIVVVLLGIAAAVLTYLLWYGGVRGPIDWLAGKTVHRGAGVRREIALTFDDGPDPARTPALLAALAELDVKATFFLVGAGVDAHPEVCRQIAAAGHELGNHTYRHPYLPLVGAARVAEELAATDRAIARATGVVPTLARPPWGARRPSTVRTFARLAKRLVLWDVNTFDWRGASAPQIADRVLARARPGSIVLMHDAREGGEVTVEAVRLLVPALRARGFELVTVSRAIA